MTAPGGSAYSSRNRDTPVGMALGRLGPVGPEPEAQCYLPLASLAASRPVSSKAILFQWIFGSAPAISLPNTSSSTQKLPGVVEVTGLRQGDRLGDLTSLRLQVQGSH